MPTIGGIFGTAAGKSFFHVNPHPLKIIADGYFKQYNRQPLKSYNTGELIFIRDYCMKLVGETRIAEYLEFLRLMSNRYGVVQSEALQYINSHSEYKQQLLSTQNLESGNVIEAAVNGIKSITILPAQGIAAAVANGANEMIVTFFKKMIPSFLIIAAVYIIVKNRHKFVKK